MWYQAPAHHGGMWLRHTIDASINFVHQGSLQIGDFNADGRLDIAFAEQDRSPTRRVGILYNPGSADGRWRLQILSLNGGQNIKVGSLGRSAALSILTARHGYFGGANPLVAWTGPTR